MINHIMIVDDDSSLCRAIEMTLKKTYDVTIALDGEHALNAIRKKQPDTLLLDIGLPKTNGIEVLKVVKLKWPEIPVIMITAVDEVKTIVTAIREGAYDYLVKPINTQELLVTIKNALEKKRLRTRIQALDETGKETYRFESLEEYSSMKRVLDIARIAANSDANAPVLITGETGTGKSMLARMIHYNRLDPGPFVIVNCGAIAGNLVESELFGYEPGTFTGALSTGKKGRFEIARDGTIFLDEIGAMPLIDQTKLLGVLEDRLFYRVGGVSPIEMNSQLISASNIDFEKAIARGKFRRDLYFRINVIEIEMPPLRNRVKEIPILADHFLKEYSQKFNKRFSGMAPEALQWMGQYAWPGNVREMRNLLERIVLLENDDMIRLKHLRRSGKKRMPEPIQFNEFKTLDYNTVTKQLIQEAIRRADNNITQAARMLNMPLHKLRYQLKKLGLR